MAANRSSSRAAAYRQRRDIVSGQSFDEDDLIRFVAAPDGSVALDLARKLPGRGLWVKADRGSVEAATRKSLFSRAAKARLAAPPDLADLVEQLLASRILAGLGLARKAGAMVLGFEKVLAAIGQGDVTALLEASDGSADGRRKILSAARRGASSPLLVGMFSSAELGLALGEENVIHSAFLAGRGADRWILDVRRLAGVRPLLPEGWREDSRDGDVRLGRVAVSAPRDDLERSGPTGPANGV